MTHVGYDRITTTIRCEWLAQIIAGAKKIEYRQIKPYCCKYRSVRPVLSGAQCGTPMRTKDSKSFMVKVFP